MSLLLSGNIFWHIPEYLQTNTSYDCQKIYRSSNEVQNYHQLDTIALADVSGNFIETYYDASAMPAEQWYLVTLASSTTGAESNWFQAVTDLNPREARLVGQIRNYMPPIINKYVSDIVMRQAIAIGLTQFNTVSPMTDYTLQDFPYELEMLVVYPAMIAVVIGQFLPISIRDFSYSGVTPSISIDRMAKLQATITVINDYYKELIRPVKMDLGLFGAPTALGTFALPLSLGSKLAPGLLNIFDMLKVGG